MSIGLDKARDTFERELELAYKQAPRPRPRNVLGFALTVFGSMTFGLMMGSNGMYYLVSNWIYMLLPFGCIALGALLLDGV